MTATPRTIFIGLPVTDLARSMRFYAALGFANDARFTDETAACMRASETINVMLMTHERWRQYHSRPIPPPTASGVALVISQDSREAVNRLTALVPAHGGMIDIDPVQDHQVMLSRTIADPDGHVWELMWMDPAATAEPSQ